MGAPRRMLLVARRDRPRSTAVTETNMDVWIVPGLGGSDEGHWQSRWHRAHAGWKRVEQDDWDRPTRARWVERLGERVRSNGAPVILVAHSLGCATIAHAAAAGLLGDVVGAFLVAMPDVEREDFPSEVCEGFAPLPRRALPFATVMVASTDDPWCDLDVSARWAEVFGATLETVGARHHIGSAAGLGAWDEGLALFDRFAARVYARGAMVDPARP
jgi:predicted alpha/beta hydrolase family esterase